MNILGGVTDFFGLDIGTTGVRIVQLRGSGPTRTIYCYGQTELDVRTARSDAQEDQAKLGEAIKQLVAETGVTTSNVAVGLPNNQVFTTVVDMARMDPDEMAGAIRYQADSIIPTPIDQSKIDWAIIGDSPKDTTKVEVILSSVSNSIIEKRLDMLESIGLNVIAFEPDVMALARALSSGASQSNQLILDIGNNSSDLIISMKGAPRLTRSIPLGSSIIIRTAMQHLSVDENQAGQFVFKFGLSRDKLEGKIYNAVIDAINELVSEVEKSIKFFSGRYNTTVENIILTGAAAIIPQFPLYLANKLGLSVEIGNAWTNVSFPASQQNELMAIANRYGVAAGLAERTI